MISTALLQALHARERQRFLDSHPRSGALAAASAPHFLYGVPLHWMRDWGLPHPLFVASAQGNRLRCADGLEYVDFCLGDTGAMFGHSPPPVARAIAEQAGRGLTAMLPGEPLAAVGAALERVFGLPRWQITLSASDANRFVLRWGRAVTGRRKVLVFDGCYHGTVDDTLVDRGEDGRTLTRASLLGQVHDLALGTVVVPFNDAAAVEAALAGGDVACVLTEPALTNFGLVPPAPGFLEAVQALCRAHGVLFVLDETHTVSTGLGGYARVHGLQPDVLVVGKAVAGGLPCAVYGFTEALAQRMAAAKDAAPQGHSGIGTTLSANVLALAALRASLDEVMTAPTYAAMQAAADRLEGALRVVIERRRLPWTVTRLGARMELQFCETTPADAAQARAAMDNALERALHMALLNRGIVITPFHNMLLVPPMAAAADADAVAAAVDAFVGEVLA
jgi:glutamate-1-semialdehyde 2,1-aminomutase